MIYKYPSSENQSIREKKTFVIEKSLQTLSDTT